MKHIFAYPLILCTLAFLASVSILQVSALHVPNCSDVPSGWYSCPVPSEVSTACGEIACSDRTCSTNCITLDKVLANCSQQSNPDQYCAQFPDSCQAGYIGKVYCNESSGNCESVCARLCSSITMSVSPDPSTVGQSIGFNLSSGSPQQGDTFVIDSISGVNSCNYSAGFWPSAQCTAASAGSQSWTHKWENVNCAGNDCVSSGQCSQTKNFTINPTPTPTPTSSPGILTLSVNATQNCPYQDITATWTYSGTTYKSVRPILLDSLASPQQGPCIPNLNTSYTFQNKIIGGGHSYSVTLQAFSDTTCSTLVTTLNKSVSQVSCATPTPTPTPVPGPACPQTNGPDYYCANDVNDLNSKRGTSFGCTNVELSGGPSCGGPGAPYCWHCVSDSGPDPTPKPIIQTSISFSARVVKDAVQPGAYNTDCVYQEVGCYPLKRQCNASGTSCWYVAGGDQTRCISGGLWEFSEDCGGYPASQDFTGTCLLDNTQKCFYGDGTTFTTTPISISNPGFESGISGWNVVQEGDTTKSSYSAAGALTLSATGKYNAIHVEKTVISSASLDARYSFSARVYPKNNEVTVSLVSTDGQCEGPTIRVKNTYECSVEEGVEYCTGNPPAWTNYTSKPYRIYPGCAGKSFKLVMTAAGWTYVTSSGSFDDIALYTNTLTQTTAPPAPGVAGVPIRAHCEPDRASSATSGTQTQTSNSGGGVSFDIPVEKEKDTVVTWTCSVRLFASPPPSFQSSYSTCRTTLETNPWYGTSRLETNQTRGSSNWNLSCFSKETRGNFQSNRYDAEGGSIQPVATLILKPVLSTISGKVLRDAGLNSCASGATGYPGASLYLSLPAIQTTDSGGNYSFTLLPLGSYSLSLSNISGGVVAVRRGGIWQSTTSTVVPSVVVPPNQVVDFCVNDLASSAWIQTTGGDVHSNININTPGGP